MLILKILGVGVLNPILRSGITFIQRENLNLIFKVKMNKKSVKFAIIIKMSLLESNVIIECVMNVIFN